MATGTTAPLTTLPKPTKVQAQPNDWQDVEDWQDVAPTPAGAMKSVSGWQEPAQRYLRNLWQNINPIEGAEGLYQAVTHLPTTAKTMLQQQAELGTKAARKFGEGDVLGGIGTGINYLLPVIGPAIEQMSEQAKSGDIAGSLGAATGLGLNLAGPEALKNIGPVRVAPPLIKNVMNPVEREAIGYAQSEGVPLSAAQTTGHEALLRFEHGLHQAPGSSARAREFVTAQQTKLGDILHGKAVGLSPTEADEVAAGQGIQSRLRTRIADLKGKADTAYGDVREALAKSQQQVQTGARTETSPILDVGGKPITTTTPTFGTFEAPVDMTTLRSKLAPIYDQLTAGMPPARRDLSPAYSALKQIMEGDASTLNAMDVDRGLSALKTMVREGADNPYLSTQSQRAAVQTIGQVESEFKKALSSVDPQLLTKLQEGRSAVSSYHRTAELLADLPEEPAALYNRVMAKGDTIHNTLNQLNSVAPAEMKTAARTFLEGLYDKATAEGGFTRAAGVFQDWQRLGDRTKVLLFGAPLKSELDKFFVAAKKLSSPVSMTGAMSNFASASSYGGLGAAFMAMMTGHPEAATGMAVTGMAMPNVAARLLFTPSGVRLLTRALTLDPSTPAFRTTMQFLNARYLQEQKKEGAKFSNPEIPPLQVKGPGPGQ